MLKSIVFSLVFLSIFCPQGYSQVITEQTFRNLDLFRGQTFQLPNDCVNTSAQISSGVNTHTVVFDSVGLRTLDIQKFFPDSPQVTVRDGCQNKYDINIKEGVPYPKNLSLGGQVVRLGNKLYFPQLNTLKQAPNFAIVNGKMLAIKKDNQNKLGYFADAGSLSRDLTIYVTFPNFDGVWTSGPKSSAYSSRTKLLITKDSLKNVQEFIRYAIKSQYNAKVKPVDDWSNIYFVPNGRLPEANQADSMCGRMVYTIGNMTDEQNLGLNTISPEVGSVNPTSTLWPTTDSEKESVAKINPLTLNPNHVYKYTNLNDKYSGWAKYDVVIHLLDTSSNLTDTFEYPYGGEEKTGHGRVIGQVIEELTKAAGFKNRVFIDYINVCSDGSCREIDVARHICNIAKQANNDQSKSVRHIINMSMGSKESQPMLKGVISDAIRSNVSIVMSYGNKSTCRQQYSAMGEIPQDKDSCHQFPADDFNSTSYKKLDGAEKIVEGLKYKDDVKWSGLYVVGSEYDRNVQEVINRTPASTDRNAYVSIFSPAASVFPPQGTRPGTSFSAAYFSAGLAMWRSCSKGNQLGPSIRNSNWFFRNSKGQNFLDFDLMLKDACK